MKQYNGEKAIISLTSWKARINTVSKTIYSLIKHCKDFHIVLVLSEEEFPKKEAELPENLLSFIDMDLIEILWVYKNYKSFKKWIFTANKYPKLPVISADDDCVYTCNYAQYLYEKWLSLENKNVSIRWSLYKNKSYTPSGASNLYYGITDISLVTTLPEDIINASLDDDYFGSYFKKINYQCTYYTDIQIKPFIFHDDIEPLTLKHFKENSVYRKGFYVGHKQ